ncbi:EAL domain-containing protein [Salinivibrio sp. ES.052]|uniref:bifunctional diguanylate cyclase/phosphodiesterase n=1 Tax=Salinivibrio sp. ES.052 TaxID=1882823 RepID=UPI0009296487|nr:EAL domain-containing protein [Salinivibrio sp. ES.052]SIO24053.1 diguanylate cyclase/phosphodiesterase [Salinivibrio sp. ES.052]
MRPLSIRTAVMLPVFLVLTLTLVVIIITINNHYRSSSQFVGKLLLEDYSQGIELDLRQYLVHPFNANIFVADSLAARIQDSAMTDVGLRDYLLNSYTSLYQAMPYMQVLSIGVDAKGDYFGFRKSEAGQYILMEQSDATQNTLRIFDGRTPNANIVYQDSHYDPRIRPWYIPAFNREQPRWTDIYRDADEVGNVSLSAIAPVMVNGNVWGVVASDIKLNAFNHFLSERQEKLGGALFIVDKDGRMVAHSGQDSPTNILHFPDITNNPVLDSTISEVSDAWPPEPDKLGSPFHFDIADQGHFYGTVKKISLPAPFQHEWYVVVALPDQLLLKNLLSQQEISIYLVVAMSVIGLLVVYFIIRQLTRPLRDTAEAAAKLASGNLTYRINTPASLREIAILKEAFNNMSGKMQESFNALRQQVRQDNLTQLYTREGLVEQAAGLRYQTPNTLVIVGINGFRNINDSLGQEGGDALLRAIAQRLTDLAEDSGMLLARVRGDEFAILAPHTTNRTQSEALVDQLLILFNRPVTIGNDDVLVDACAGVVFGYTYGDAINESLHHAGLALSEAKRSETNMYVYFEASMQARIQEQSRLLLELHHAVQHHEFVVYYQPFVRLIDGYFCGAEALVRWKSPTRGMVSPAEFIPVAEHSGLINQIGMQVLEQAAYDTVAQIQKGLWPANFQLHVNLSARQLLSADFIDKLKSVLDKTQLPTGNLTLEITESQLMSHEHLATSGLTRIRALGIKIAIDDFGTGYSSLAYLHQMAFDSLKIDRSFVHSMTENSTNQRIIEAVVAMTRGMDVHLVAEGIETQEEAERLRDIGCHYAQGFLFAKPLPLAEQPTERVTDKLPTR